MSEKATKDTVNYRRGSLARHCGLCTMFRPPQACTAVAGTVYSSGVCDLFKLAPPSAREAIQKARK